MVDIKQEPVDFTTMDRINEVGAGGISENIEIQEKGIVMLGSLSCLKLEQTEIGVTENGLDKESEGIVAKVEIPVECGNKVEDLGYIVEEEIRKVSVSGSLSDKIAEADIGNRSIVSDSVAEVVSKSEEVAISSRDEESSVHDINVNGSTGNGDMLKGDEGGNSSDSESESESPSTSSSDDDEEEEDESSSKEEAEEVDMEEGEILSDPDEMVAWDEDDIDTGVKGPIRSKNEAQVLPPVPAVTAALEPHHQMLPVGVVSSILGAQVVVEGVEKHTPLYDGSILWITESRSPLGIVDEIFGPVKNPYYIVRYNSDNEVPRGIHPGTLVSFVPEFAKHVLNDKTLYKKGYDASNENDEEVSEEEEFSDDEKEAEYKRMMKMKKRGATNDQKLGNSKKDKRKLKSRSQNWKHNQAAATDAELEKAKPPVDQSQPFIPAAAGSLGQGIPALSSGVWTNGIPYQQPQNMGFPNTLPSIGMPWPQQSHPQQMFPMPLPNAVPFEQQINPTLASSFIFPGGQSNFGVGPSFVPWPALGQNMFSQPPLTMGVPGQVSPTPMAFGGHVLANGPQMGLNNNPQLHAAVPGHNDGSPNFNQGTHSGGGQRGNRGGGGRFGGRRGRMQRN